MNIKKYRINLSEINGVIRPGIVHRIDKNTSGILVVAKNNETMIERPFYFRNGKEYMWVCLDSYELEKGYDFTFNIEFAQASVAVDKLFITQISTM